MKLKNSITARRRAGRTKRFELSRSTIGASLTELLIASLLIGFTTALIGELVVTTTLSSIKSNNSSNILSTAKISTERLIYDVKTARSIGDYYGESNHLSPETIQFPSPVNPLYGSGGFQPENGWPQTPWPGPPYQLSAQCLILQQPVVFYARANSPDDPFYSPNANQDIRNGFPFRIQKDQISEGLPSETIENLDTVVYQLVADTERPGEYVLQLARFPGYHDPNWVNETHYEPAINPPQTIAKGIIGPRPPGNPTGAPEIFRYLAHDTGFGIRELSTAELANDDNGEFITGVAIDLEFKRSDLSTTATDVSSQNLGIHSEAFLKNNRLEMKNGDG